MLFISTTGPRPQYRKADAQQRRLRPRRAHVDLPSWLATEDGVARSIRIVDIAALAGPSGAARDAADRALGEAAEDMGFLVVTGGPVDQLADPARIAGLLRLFTLPEAERLRLCNSKHNPVNDNDYRGWFALRRPAGGAVFMQGFDHGSGRPAPAGADRVVELLLEPNVWPQEALLPGWRALTERQYRDTEALGRLLMRAFARYLKLGEDYFEPFFGGGASTLRFLHAPPRPDLTAENAEERLRALVDGVWHRLGTGAHRDSGVLTLLWQQGALQAQDPDGDWLTAPAAERSLTVNFGDCLEFWTGGRLRATPHRVLAVEQDRYSMPFFFEPDVESLIRPIPGAPPAPAIRYADHVFEKIKLFGTHSTARVEKAA